MPDEVLKMALGKELKPPPSLWTYFETLPDWCRDHPYVRDVLMGLEYHQNRTSIKDKELALNYACSLIRPIGKDLRRIIWSIATSNKLRMNVERAKLLKKDLPYYEVTKANVFTPALENDEMENPVFSYIPPEFPFEDDV
jgi:hypothetical protein